MGVMDSLRRAVLGGGTPTTESIQRHILTLLDGHGSLASDSLPDLMSLPVGHDAARGLIDQAAQILVNRGDIDAIRDGKRVDPVSTDQPYRLSRSQGK